MKVEAIVLAGGKGTRLNSKVKKQYIKLNDKDILYYTLKSFENIESVDSVIVVCNDEEVEYIKSYGFTKVNKFADSGKERMYSVNNALKVLDDKTDVVIVHDGVRPFFDVNKIDELIKCANKDGGAIFAVKSTDTIKKVCGNVVLETVDRSNLYNVQTPQAFDKQILLDCYEKALKQNIFCTDDSMVVENFSETNINIIESDYSNIKITTKIDLEIAKAIIGGQNEKS